MDSQAAILELIELIYSAAEDPSAWALVLRRLTLAVGGNAATLHHQDTRSQESSFSTLWNLSQDDVAPYDEYYGSLNPLTTTRPDLIRAGTVNTSQMLCPDEIYTRGEYFHDFLRPRDMLHVVAPILRSDSQGANFSALSIFRPVNGEPFGEEERRFLLLLVPHLQRAFQLHNRIHGLERKGNAASDALDQLQQGLVLLDAKGHVLLVNRAATALFAREKSLKLTPSGLRAAVPSENRELIRLIKGAIATGNHNGMDSGGAMFIARSDSRHPLQVLVTPLRTKTIHIGKDLPVAAIFIYDPDCKPVSNSTVFAQLFGLTRAETRLAQILASGQSMKDAAARLGVAQSTLRSQLKSIFAKTNTNRQGELVRLLLLAPVHMAQAEVIGGGSLE
jgi:DNA-binding CsgD family transcriptional regulator/PAS domain-containing protein